MAVVRKISVMSALVLFCALMPASAQAPASPQDDGGERVFAVKGIVGSVKVRRSPNFAKVRRERAVKETASAPIDTAWLDARLNMTVREKDEVMTGPQSEVRLETADGIFVKLGENTTAEISILQFGTPGRKTSKSQAEKDRREGVTATKVKVNDGSVVANVNKLLSGKSSVRFETPTATAAIRGTTLELDVRKGERTVVRVFDGTVQVAPAGTDKFVDVGHGKMAELVPGQKAVVVKDIPKSYRRRTTRVRGEKVPAENKPAKESRAAPKKKDGKAELAKADDPVSVRLTIDLGDSDTIDCRARDSITIEGAVQPAGAKVSVNGIAASQDKDGVFKVTIAAPSESGIFPIKIVAEDNELTDTVIRTMKVAPARNADKEKRK